MIQIEQISKYVPYGREFSKIHPSTSNLMKDYEGIKIRGKKVLKGLTNIFLINM